MLSMPVLFFLQQWQEIGTFIFHVSFVVEALVKSFDSFLQNYFLCSQHECKAATVVEEQSKCS
jgi:hypothetical protein